MNMKFKFNIVLLSLWLFLGYSHLFAQNNSGIWIDPNKSDPTKRRSLYMSGNNIETMVGNWGNVAQGQDPIGGIWPKGTGHDHIFEFTGFVAAEVQDSSGNKVVIISDGYIDGGGTSGEFDRVTNIEYKYHPLPGYFNEVQGQDEFANSLNPVSWPPTWPGKDETWNGKWNGFFGLNQFNADQEAMYYIDDAWNNEFPFYPYNDYTDRKGLGIQISTRLFQWAHPLAKDILFYYFDITNVGDFEYLLDKNPIYFGGFGDIGPGGRGTVDDDAAFNDEIDIVYGWDHDNVGVWNRNRDIPPGYLGWKFLESPGIETDGLDNDADGLVDERRDNDAGTIVFGPVGKYGDPKEHWSGDEDGDWLAIVDDVGADGIMELDEGYPGPDKDGTEGNGKPDQGEPNFGKLDNDESDQVGLTAFSAPLYGAIMISDEEAMWPRIQPGYFVDPQQSVNQFWIFASGPINLPSSKTERFSTCFVFAFTETALFKAASVAQRIFDSDYRFAKPPRQPRLQAVAGDKKVFLTWDESAEYSRDPVYGFDFEGYRIYRSTDPQFLDVEDITDSQGNPMFKVPIAQFDLNNGLKGPHPLQFGEEIEDPNGIHFYMGDDTGLKHYFIDENLVNGRTYYYAVTSYDKGYDDDFFERELSEYQYLYPITPAESPASIVVTEGEISRMDPNTAEVTPNSSSSNLNEAATNVAEFIHETGFATGNVEVSIVDAPKVKDSEYEITFTTEESDRPGERETNTFSIYDLINQSYLVENEQVPWALHNDNYYRTWVKEVFDEGIILEFNNQFPDENYTKANSGWVEGHKSNYKVSVGLWVLNSSLEPVSFVIEFGAEDAVLDSSFKNTSGRSFFEVNYKVYDYYTGEPTNFLQKEFIKNGRIDPGENIAHMFKPDPSSSRYSSSWGVFFEEPQDEYGNILPQEEWIAPQEGDKIVVLSKINFSEDDTLSFQTFARQLDKSGMDESVLDNINVVPNPYVVSSILEKQPFLTGRGERFIRFTNLPAECTIHIYTVNGDLVQTLEHNSLDNGTIRWDLKSKDNLEVAFGLYVYHVDAPGIGEKIGKFAIIN